MSTLTNEYRHIPVMLQEVMQFIEPNYGLEGKTFVDCTLGGAGHSLEIAKKLGERGLLIGIDQDQTALKAAKNNFAKLKSTEKPDLSLVNDNFGNLNDILLAHDIAYADAILMDLGMSSEQIDNIDRGFSFKQNCPLDMRMDPVAQTLNAARIVNFYSVNDLIRVLRNFSDEKFAKEIAFEIDKCRKIKKIETSFELVDIIKKAIPAYARRKGGHPAKRTFQALRIEVNDELKVLKMALESAIKWLAPGGRLVVISYHSLEDRIVKDMFSAMENRCTCPPDFPKCMCGRQPVVKCLTNKPVVTSNKEIESNSRARSAKLRAVEKL